MTSEFGKRLRQTFVDSVTKGIGVAGSAHFGPLWAALDPFVRLAMSTFNEPPADRAVAALLAQWEKQAAQEELVNRALHQFHDGLMKGLKDQFTALDALEVQRRGGRETLSRQTISAALAGLYFKLSYAEALRYLRILGLSDSLLSQHGDTQYLSMLRDALSCQVHPLARFSFEAGLCSVQAAGDIDIARVNLKLAARWVGLSSLVEPFFRDLQPFLDARDQDGLIEFVKDFAGALAVFAGAPNAPM